MCGMQYVGSKSSSCSSISIILQTSHGQRIMLSSLSLLGIVFISGKGVITGRQPCLRLITRIVSSRWCGQQMDGRNDGKQPLDITKLLLRNLYARGETMMTIRAKDLY